MTEVDAHFMDCKFDGTCKNVNDEAKGIHFSASQDPAPLSSAEHIKFMAAFFNKEKLATELFAATMDAYKKASVAADPKPRVAWISFSPKSEWAEPKFTLSQANYKLVMTKAAGGATVDGAAVKAKMGDKMTVAEAATGKTYDVLLAGFTDKAAASTAFFDALKDVDVIVDETYAVKPSEYTFETFMTNFGLNKDSTLKFMKSKMVLRIDGTVSENEGLDWYESRIAHPDWAVEGLAHQIHSASSKTYMYFRNLAKNEVPKVLTKAMCKATLPACDANALPAPIDMMVAKAAKDSTSTKTSSTTKKSIEPTSNAGATSLCLLLSLFIVGAQV